MLSKEQIKEITEKLLCQIATRVDSIKTAEDLTQSILMKAYITFDPEKKASFKTWCFIIKRTVLIDYYRRKKNHQEFDPDNIEEINADELYDDYENVTKLEKLDYINYLTDCYKVLIDDDEKKYFIHLFIDKMKREEIIAIEKWPELKATSTYKKLKRKMEKIAKDKGYCN